MKFNLRRSGRVASYFSVFGLGSESLAKDAAKRSKAEEWVAWASIGGEIACDRTQLMEGPAKS